ncbi:MAG: WYL domain-containing protein [Actinobacteria bacterium]|nr:MAG: WYL domain-containing protein [Actinomycetota bacterium]
MRATRLVSLLLHLQLRGQLTAAELAEHFAVSIRTVHRDVEALAAAGIPVEAIRGPAGGYRLAGNYRTKLTGLTAAEAEALFAAPAPAAELGLGGVLTSARLKLLAALPAELQERAGRAERFFHLDTRRWFRAEDTVPHLPTIAAATWEGRRLSARYREGTRVVRRTLDPLGLVLKGGAWYLVARRSAGMRVYRVSRFASIRVREDGFERPEGFDLAEYWRDWSQSFEASLPRVEVKLRASELVRRRLPEDLRSAGDACVVGFQSLEDAFRELLKFGPDAEVLEPAELRERIAAAAHEVVELYAG